MVVVVQHRRVLAWVRARLVDRVDASVAVLVHFDAFDLAVPIQVVEGRIDSAIVVDVKLPHRRRTVDTDVGQVILAVGVQLGTAHRSQGTRIGGS